MCLDGDGLLLWKACSSLPTKEYPKCICLFAKFTWGYLKATNWRRAHSSSCFLNFRFVIIISSEWKVFLAKEKVKNGTIKKRLDFNLFFKVFQTVYGNSMNIKNKLRSLGMIHLSHVSQLLQTLTTRARPREPGENVSMTTKFPVF